MESCLAAGKCGVSRFFIRSSGKCRFSSGLYWYADEYAQTLLTQTDAFIHPYDAPLVWQGHSTLIDEVVAAGIKPDALVVTVGGGGICRCDARLKASCLTFINDHRLVVEPAAGAALPVLYNNHALLADAKQVLVVVCGGATATVSQLERWYEKSS